MFFKKKKKKEEKERKEMGRFDKNKKAEEKKKLQELQRQSASAFGAFQREKIESSYANKLDPSKEDIKNPPLNQKEDSQKLLEDAAAHLAAEQHDQHQQQEESFSTKQIIRDFQNETGDSDGDSEAAFSEGELEEQDERLDLILQEETSVEAILNSVEDLSKLSFEEVSKVLKVGVLAEGTLRTYKSWQNSMLSRGFSNCPRGLLSFILSRDPSCLKICNKTMEYIVVAFKHFYFLDQQERLTDVEAIFVEKALQMRKRHFPDANRATGAMNSEKTELFLEFVDKKKKKGELNDYQHQIIRDAATMLYACALRVSQLIHLSSGDECFRKIIDLEDGKMVDLTVTVISKGHQARKANQTETGIGAYETKQVHPFYQERVMEIINRRAKKDDKFFYDFERHRKTYSNTLQEAALHYGWPEELRFSGTHVSRHGAAQDAYEEGGLDLTMLRTGHLSQKSAQYYALSDAQRIEGFLFKRKTAEEKAKVLKQLQQVAKR